MEPFLLYSVIWVLFFLSNISSWSDTPRKIQTVSRSIHTSHGDMSRASHMLTSLLYNSLKGEKKFVKVFHIYYICINHFSIDTGLAQGLYLPEIKPSFPPPHQARKYCFNKDNIKIDQVINIYHVISYMSSLATISSGKQQMMRFTPQIFSPLIAHVDQASAVYI